MSTPPNHQSRCCRRDEKSRLPSISHVHGRFQKLQVLCLGTLAILWLLLRSGVKPSRIQYPCQQSSLNLAVLAFGATGFRAIMDWRERLFATLRMWNGKAIGALLVTILCFGLVVSGPEWNGGNRPIPVLRPPRDYHPRIFVVDGIRSDQPARHGGVDDLITLMGVHDFKWYRSATTGPTCGPDGLIDVDDVVLLKVNAQWPERGGTNTDVVRGVIRRIVEHPDGFTGEVVVTDNGQGAGNLNRSASNAEDTSQSIQDVVDDFIAEGWNVSTFLWDTIFLSAVSEFGSGDMTNGFVVSPTVDSETGIRVSYAKFRTAAGTYVSYKYGVWSEDSRSYDSSNLVVINIPVLKTHSIYAVTASVKNHMGVVSQALNTGSHSSVGRGGMGTILADVRMPDLNILDCIWILARPGQGPSAPYNSASRRDMLLASRDPVALDIWAVKHILIPQIIANGYGESAYHATQNPDEPTSVFRRYLDQSMNEMILGGIATTNNQTAAVVYEWIGDFDADGDLDLSDLRDFVECLAGPGTAVEPACVSVDLDEDGSITIRDFLAFHENFTGSL